MKSKSYMKARKVISLILFFTLISIFAACAPSGDPTGSQGNTNPSLSVSSNNYEIYVYKASAMPCLDNVITAEVLWPTVTQPEADEMKTTIRIDGSDYEMDYVRTYNVDHMVYRMYKTADNSVDCLYNASDNELVRVLLVKNRSDFETMDQQQYEQWLQTFVSQFFKEDWSDYQLDCKVNTSTNPATNGTVTHWEFTYRTYIDSMETTDKLTAYFKMDSNEETMDVCVWFNRHDFDSVDTVNLNQESVSNAISAYVDANMRENYTLHNCKAIGEDKLLVINGNVMLERTVEITYKTSGQTRTCNYELIIDIPDP